MKKLKQMPVPVAIVVMVLCIVIGVAFGNNNALSDAKEAPEAILTELSALAAERTSHAKNLLVVAQRNDVDANDITALQNAIADLSDATKANAMASANKSLTFAAAAVNEQLQAGETVKDRDKSAATGEMDELGSADAILRRRAAAYNESIEEVRKTYNKLPMRWIIGGLPEVYQ